LDLCDLGFLKHRTIRLPKGYSDLNERIKHYAANNPNPKSQRHVCARSRYAIPSFNKVHVSHCACGDEKKCQNYEETGAWEKSKKFGRDEKPQKHGRARKKR
jgi:hypothetical protein